MLCKALADIGHAAQRQHCPHLWAHGLLRSHQNALFAGRSAALAGQARRQGKCGCASLRSGCRGHTGAGSRLLHIDVSSAWRSAESTGCRRGAPSTWRCSAARDSCRAPFLPATGLSTDTTHTPRRCEALAGDMLACTHRKARPTARRCRAARGSCSTARASRSTGSATTPARRRSAARRAAARSPAKRCATPPPTCRCAACSRRAPGKFAFQTGHQQALNTLQAKIPWAPMRVLEVSLESMSCNGTSASS